MRLELNNSVERTPTLKSHIMTRKSFARFLSELSYLTPH